jgi:DNA-binding transcriptional regulator/RsmH inhibitor MraZ
LLDEALKDSIWARLTSNPKLQELLYWGYDYIYIDSRGWATLPPEITEAADLDAACVVVAAEVWDNSHVNFRRLLDLRDCQ